MRKPTSKKELKEMPIKRSEFWEWMNTCPIKEKTGKTEGWLQVNDYFESIEIRFPVDEDEEEIKNIKEVSNAKPR